MVRTALALGLLAASGCGFDERVIEVRPDPLIVDTFEDGDVYPTDRRFRKWESALYGTDKVVVVPLRSSHRIALSPGCARPAQVVPTLGSPVFGKLMVIAPGGGESIKNENPVTMCAVAS
jgi:hypothetical protein